MSLESFVQYIHWEVSIMKACLIVTIFLVVGHTVVTSAAEIGDADAPHTMVRRETIQGPPLPGRCVFYECIASCRQRGYKSGGYCTLNGCQCLR
nr:gallerimycin-like [Helicoverpa armigera]